MISDSVHIIDASSPAEIDAARALFRKYEASLGISLCFQSFEEELAALPGKYAPPKGGLLLARNSTGWCGCVAFRPLTTEICELKRLFVLPEAQGLGTGRLLVDSALSRAKAAGYHSIRLDTLPMMERAIRMYRAYGFREIPPYTTNPVEGALFLELSLRP